jgi:hypothetical protein
MSLLQQKSKQKVLSFKLDGTGINNAWFRHASELFSAASAFVVED